MEKYKTSGYGRRITTLEKRSREPGMGTRCGNAGGSATRRCCVDIVIQDQ